MRKVLTLLLVIILLFSTKLVDEKKNEKIIYCTNVGLQKSDKEKLTLDTVISENFWDDLKKSIDFIITENDDLTILNRYGDNYLIRSTKYILKNLQTKVSMNTDISDLIIFFLRILESFKDRDKTEEIRIFSLASGKLKYESALLSLFIYNGYKNLKLYAVDPCLKTQKAIEELNKDSNIQNNVAFKYFTQITEYQEYLSKYPSKLPEISITIYPCPADYNDKGINHVYKISGDWPLPKSIAIINQKENFYSLLLDKKDELLYKSHLANIDTFTTFIKSSKIKPFQVPLIDF